MMGKYFAKNQKLTKKHLVGNCGPQFSGLLGPADILMIASVEFALKRGSTITLSVEYYVDDMVSYCPIVEDKIFISNGDTFFDKGDIIMKLDMTGIVCDKVKVFLSTDDTEVPLIVDVYFDYI